MILARVGAANDHGEGIFKAERLRNFQRKSSCVTLFNSTVNCGCVIFAGSFVEHRGKGGAGVFDVKVKSAGKQRFVAEQRASEIGFTDHPDASAGFDVLRKKFREDDLLGEELRADDNGGL